MNDSLGLSNRAIDLIKGIEKLALKPYDDQTGVLIKEWAKGATIGYGHLISKEEWPILKDGITKEGAENLFNCDLAPFAKSVRRTIIVPLQQNEFDALVILAFNIGKNHFETSSVVSMINDPKSKSAYPTLEKAWKAWDKSQGKENGGLKNRRNCEWKIYTQGVYDRW